MRDVTIEAPESSKKGRSFHALLLAYAEADPLWSGGQSAADTIRPVWAMFAGSEQELRAFAANLLSGRKVLFGGERQGYSRKQERMEFLRSAGYQTIWQREDEGSLLTVFLPELFQLDPGMIDPHGLTFVMMPPRSWLAEQQIDTARLHEHAMRCGYDLPAERISELAPLAFLFAAYVDRRTHCPLIADGRFYMQLLLAMLTAGLASFGSRETYGRDEFGVNNRLRYQEHDTGEVGLVPGVVCSAAHDVFEKLLAEEAGRYFGIRE